MSMRFPPGPDFADLAVLAEELGYSRVWIYDSAPLWEDPFVPLARVSGGRFRACFGTGFTARLAVGRRPMTPDALAEYVTALRRLLAGEIAPEDERHLLTCEGHVTHLPDRDRRLLDHIGLTMVGDAARVGRSLARLADLGFHEVVYTPSGPDVARELRALATAQQQRSAADR
ncbi:hypothetical protein [Streptomyces mirabilis]|uniref:hypothetical protein n=1 Tax=Streptomyces mirabilis TaxID=68239 RepID=UPI0033339E3E